MRDLMPRRLLAVGLMLALAACAEDPHRGGFHQGGPPGGQRVARRLFISPSGEPFRGDDGLAAWFARADANHDGVLTLEEFQADAVRFFKYLDTNGDGVVDGFEIQAYEQNIAPEIAANDFDGPDEPRAGAQTAQSGGGRGGRGGGRGRRGGGGAPGGGSGGRVTTSLEGASRFGLINEPEPVANADENLDSKVTAEEWRHATLRRFQTLDKAKTGRLTLDALKGIKPAPAKKPA
ncbi:MAG: hypothetical protein E7812_15270 [Phenylobacterium sp.]|nr:MAG: hypothetical protein E7812_15270 [Phenylobacterium sp.]